MSKFFKYLKLIYTQMWRLLDFSGSYNRIILEERLSIPGFLRDRMAFDTDRRAIQGDIQKAMKRFEDEYGKHPVPTQYITKQFTRIEDVENNIFNKIADKRTGNHVGHSY